MRWNAPYSLRSRSFVGDLGANTIQARRARRKEARDANRGMLRKPRPKPWTIWSGLALIALIHVLALVRSAPPAPLGLAAPEREFSAERAAAVLARILGDGEPHPLGTPS